MTPDRGEYRCHFLSIFVTLWLISWCRRRFWDGNISRPSPCLAVGSFHGETEGVAGVGIDRYGSDSKTIFVELNPFLFKTFADLNGAFYRDAVTADWPQSAALILYILSHSYARRRFPHNSSITPFRSTSLCREGRRKLYPPGRRCPDESRLSHPVREFRF